MTGYGRSQFEILSNFVSVEVFSVNKRNLEIAVYCPKEWQCFETKATELVRQHIQRGRIRISVTVEQAKQNFKDLLGSNILEGDLSALKRFMEDRGYKFQPSTDSILQIARIANENRTQLDYKEVLPHLNHSLTIAIKEMKTMREKEGIELQNDFRNRIKRIEEIVSEIEILSKNVAEDYAKKLLKKLKNFAKEMELNDDRLLKEVVLYSEKTDISEELTRLNSHAHQLNETLLQENSVGRKIEFLLQEFSRELNTICSKSPRVQCTQLALEGRNEVEKMKEQAMNVE